MRASLSSDTQSLQPILKNLLPLLEVKPEWYGSIYFECKQMRRYSVDLRKSNVTDNTSKGVVFRIYDGYTLYEQATDHLEPDALKLTAQSLTKRVLKIHETEAPQGPRRIYQPPQWKERLNAPLDEEILSQISKSPQADQFVHFGIRVKEDPFALSNEQVFQKLQKNLERVRALSLKVGLDPKSISYLSSSLSLAREEALFVDRETALSQTLYRLALTVLTMSGADRTYTRVGGLGGLETIALDDSKIEEILEDLKGLKSADRLEPGRYRVLFAPGLSGVLAHEAFGHSQEGDTCARGRSKAWDLFHSGEIVGNEHATILNNPAIYKNGEEDWAAWGSYFFDEEGWLAQEQVLLDQGKLTSPMTNLTSSIRLNVPRTANGKRESWKNGVYTRQTNTYFSAGKNTYEELLSQISDGFLATDCAGGMEDPKGMGIQVGIPFLKEVKNGKLTGRYFKGPAGGDIQLTGYTPDVLRSIVGKSKIAAHTKDPDRGKHPENDVGGCGKYHKEFVYAGCGGPYLLLDQVILG